MLLSSKITIISSVLALQFVLLPSLYGDNGEKYKKTIHKYQLGDLTEKRLAIKSLKHSREKSLFSFFLEASRHSDHFIRRHAFEGMSHFQTEEAYQILKNSLEDTSPFVIQHSIPLFSQFSSPDAVDSILPLLKNEDNQILYTAIDTLGDIGNKEAVFHIAPFFNNSYENVQSISYLSTGLLLQKFKEKFIKNLDADYELGLKQNSLKSMDKLTEILIPSFMSTWANGAISVRKNALWCIGSMAETYLEQINAFLMFEENPELLSMAQNIKERMMSIVPLLTESYSKLQEEELRWYLVTSLIKFKTEEIIPVLLAGLKDDFFMVRCGSIQGLVMLENSDFISEITPLLKDPFEIVGIHAIQAIEQMGTHEHATQLISYLSSNNSQVKWHTAKALGNLGNQEAVRPLIFLLYSKDSLIRSITIQSLGNLGFGEAIQPLIEASHDDLYFVRENAANALGKLENNEEAFPTIAELLSDKNKHVRRSALNSLFIILKNPESKEKFKQMMPIIISTIKKDEDRVMKVKVPKFLSNLGYSSYIK